jgi:hypothetical protein
MDSDIHALTMKKVRVINFPPVLAGILILGCAYGNRSVVLNSQFATEHDCQDVTVERDGANYTVSGCEITEKYECQEDEGYVEYSDRSCRLESEQAKPVPGAQGAEVKGPVVKNGVPLFFQNEEDRTEETSASEPATDTAVEPEPVEPEPVD